MTNIPPPPKVEAMKHPVLKSMGVTLLIAVGLGAFAVEREREKELGAAKRADPHSLVNQAKHDNANPHPVGSIMHWTKLAKQFQAHPNDAKLEQQLTDDAVAKAISGITIANPNVDPTALDASKRVIAKAVLDEMQTIDNKRDLLGDHAAVKGNQKSQDQFKKQLLAVEDHLAADENLAREQMLAIAPDLDKPSKPTPKLPPRQPMP